MRPTLAVVAALALLAALPVAADSDEPPPVVGGDVDEYGCRGSAGYVWCEKTQQCERPWELAQSEGFENDADAFERFCEDD